MSYSFMLQLKEREDVSHDLRVAEAAKCDLGRRLRQTSKMMHAQSRAAEERLAAVASERDAAGSLPARALVRAVAAEKAKGMVEDFVKYAVHKAGTEVARAEAEIGHQEQQHDDAAAAAAAAAAAELQQAKDATVAAAAESATKLKLQRKIAAERQAEVAQLKTDLAFWKSRHGVAAELADGAMDRVEEFKALAAKRVVPHY